MGYLYEEECSLIIGACYEVHNNLGCGFLEPVYQEALAYELASRGIPFIREKRLNIYYKDIKLEKLYKADFVCFDNIILEIKAKESLIENHSAQLLNYLKATNLKLGLLINFGTPRTQIKRIIY